MLSVKASGTGSQLKRLVLAQALKNGVATGDFAPDLDIGIAKNLIITMSTGVIDWWRPDGDLSADELAGRIAHYAVNLVSSPAQPPTAV